MTKHAVTCPWSDEHTTAGDPNDTSTVIFEPTKEGERSGFNCLHAHCAGRTVRDVLQKLGVTPQDSFLAPRGELEKERQLQPITLAAFLAEHIEPITWVVDKYIPEGGLVLLASYPKVGKTTLAYALIIAVAKGQRFMGYQTRKGTVLLLAIEEHRRDIKRRLLRFGAWGNDPILVHPAPLDHDPRVFSDLAMLIREHQIQLVVLDTLGSFWQIADENDNALVQRRIRPFLDLAHTTNCAVLLIHHSRKVKGEGGREIRGGSALLGAVDQALLLDYRQGGSRTQPGLRAFCPFDNTPPELVLDLAANTYTALGTVDDVGLDAVIEKVVASLSPEGQAITKIAKTTGLHVRQVRRALDALTERARVERAGAGRKGSPYTYRQPPDAIPARDHPKGKKSKPESGGAA